MPNLNSLVLCLVRRLCKKLLALIKKHTSLLETNSLFEIDNLKVLLVSKNLCQTIPSMFSKKFQKYLFDFYILK